MTIREGAGRTDVLASLMLTVPLLFASVVSSYAQNISPAQLKVVIGLSPKQAGKLRETYKAPLKSAFARQTALIGKDCQPAGDQGQQPYNICIGQADEQAERDYTVFFSNLQMLCHDQDQLTTLQAFEATWRVYRDSAIKATRASWPDGTGAPGFAGAVYLSLTRNHMSELNEMYGLNIAQ